MNSLNPEKSSGYDLITSKIIKELPIIGIKSYPVIQCSLAQRLLPGTMESRTDNPHLEARETSLRVNILMANNALTHYI
jgi:hypothetical protein